MAGRNLESIDLNPLKAPLLTYSFARSAVFTAESLFIPVVDLIVNRRRPRLPVDDRKMFVAARRSLDRLLREDIENIIGGAYPMEVLRPESPIRHFLRFPSLFAEGVRAAKRRSKKLAKEFSEEARELVGEMPDYYRRNFHFQDSGYLSSRSAKLYEHQVEVLFAGAADAMRRLIIKPMRERFGSVDGEGLVFLELGAGTGRATRFVHLAFPKAKIVAVDLSAPYLKKAQLELKRFARHDFVEADAARLPFKDGVFDAVYSVFLFHELPGEVREQVVRESLRVLKPSGFIGLVDSLQLGDAPDLDRGLEQFPREYHEPFYRHYISNPMETVFREAGIAETKSGVGFFSKVCWGLKQD